MIETLSTTELKPEQEFALPKTAPATNEDIIAYLRRSYKLAEIAVLAESDALILEVCDRLGISISDEELQAAGDAFRLEYKLIGASETLAWLQKQRITVEDWSGGIRVELLTKKLKEYLFGDAVDAHYISNRNDYKRVALSQILVSDLLDALKVAHALREENASFCALALEYSKGKQSKKNGGFVGICFITKLMPEIAQAISQAKEGEAIEPVQTKLGYHIVRVEKWFPAELNESVREEILDSLFQGWLQASSNPEPNLK
ncbi:peptidylprolyl isomerase [Chroococcidiopsis sp. CCNUC1]|uniref:peptidylprolyl isomerase n=1 Tax=Chroococcidiopsis sp. CCNUC1 TaxID=2653189 RepID=UPI0020228747|nr:peptidylprolyl isomerase [Chroococcidiopsis sp. CCNUC1]URD48506.1 peptidylprolyl isomerase [Chroococcidiopsis sp. CCNUC1]